MGLMEAPKPMQGVQVLSLMRRAIKCLGSRRKGAAQKHSGFGKWLVMKPCFSG